MLERIGELTGDEASDEARLAELARAQPWLAEEGTICETVRAHLTRNISEGAPGFLRLLAARSMARGQWLTL